MSLACAHEEGDWELFALGSLDEATQQAMASHLQMGCKECQGRFMEAQAVVTCLAATAPARQPSARVEADLMKRVLAEASSNTTWSRSRPSWTLAPWALAAACLALAGWFFWQQREVGEELTNAKAVMQALRQTGEPASPILPQMAQMQVPTPSRSSAPSVSLPAAQWQSARPADVRRLAAENEKLKEENAALSAASAASEQRVLEMQAALNRAQAHTESLTRDLQAARALPGNSPGILPGSLPKSGNEAEIAALTGQLSDSRAEVERLIQMRNRSTQVESLLASGSVQQIELRAVDPAAGKAFARVFYSRQGGLLLIADSLPKLDHEKCYQLWVIRKAAPAILSAGLLQTSDDGHGFLLVQPGDDLAQLTGLAITDEPRGGSVSALGHKLLFGAR